MHISVRRRVGLSAGGAVRVSGIRVEGQLRQRSNDLGLVVSVTPEITETVNNAIAELPSPESRRSYKHEWKSYLTWLQDHDLDVTTVRPRSISKYVSDLRDAGRAKASIGRALSVIRTLYGALVRDELMATNPAREIRPPKVDSTPKTKWIRDEADIHRLINVPASTWEERRDLTVVRLAFGLGWRRSEVARAAVEDIDGDTITAIVKGSKRLTVGVPDWVATSILGWCASAGIKSGPLFPRGQDDPRPINGAIVYRIVRQMCKRAGIEVMSPHSLRRTYVTHSEKRGVDMRKVQFSVAHSSISTTERYSKANTTASTKVGNVFDDLVK